MCIKCKNREMMQDVIGQVFDTSDALIDAFMLIERMKGRGATLDPDEQKVYDKLSRFVKAGDDEAAAADAGQVPDGLRERCNRRSPAQQSSSVRLTKLKRCLTRQSTATRKRTDRGTDVADEIDATNDRIETETALLVADACRQAAMIPTGEPGECFLCGEYFARVVFIASIGESCCGKCRDKRGLG